MTKKAKTLLDFAGVKAGPVKLHDTVLVVIDAQNEYTDGLLPLHEVSAAVGRIASLVQKARHAGAPVVHVVQIGRAGGLFDPGTENSKIIDRLLPDNETIIEKTLPNSFAKTGLDAHLKSLGRNKIIIAGFMTHMCVSATARAALDLGYQTVVVADATATRSLPDPTGDGNIKARDVQRVALAELADRFAVVVSVDEIIN